MQVQAGVGVPQQNGCLGVQQLVRADAEVGVNVGSRRVGPLLSIGVASHTIATFLVVMLEASTSTFRVTFCGAWLLMANWRCCPSMRSQYRH